MKKNFLKNLFNKKPVQTHTVSVVSSNNNLDYKENQIAPKDIYEQPMPTSIHSNISLKQSYTLAYLFDMAYIASTADNSLYLAPPYKVSHFGNSIKKYNDKFEEDVKTVAENFQKNIQISKKLDVHTNSRKILFEKIREIYPDFCLDIDKKISPEDLQIYTFNKHKFKKTLNTSNVYFENISSKDLLLQYQDNIAQIIDTQTFSKACEIEDKFVLSELSHFFDKLSELPEKEQKSFSKYKIPLRDNSHTTAFELAEKMKKERIYRLERYSSIQMLYDKLKNKHYISFESKKEFNDFDELR